MNLSYVSDRQYANKGKRSRKLKHMGMMLPVEDMEISKNFYETILERKVQYDFGDTLVFECGLMLCEKKDFAAAVGQDVNTIKKQANNMLICIEESDMERFSDFLDEHPDVKILKRMVELPRGQRVIRIYDPDMNIVEIVETMESMIRRFIMDGLTPEAASVKSEYPVDVIQKCYRKVSSSG